MTSEVKRRACSIAESDERGVNPRELSALVRSERWCRLTEEILLAAPQQQPSEGRRPLEARYVGPNQ